MDYVAPSYQGDIKSWKYPYALPVDAGNYKLQCDIVLDKTWSPQNSIYLDLNGFSITTDKENMNLMYINNSSVSIVIVDTFDKNSKGARKHYIRKDEKNGMVCNSFISFIFNIW